MSPQLYGLALILREETDDMHDMASDRFDVLAPEFERIAPPGTEVEPINCDVVFGEGPVWNAAEGALYFVDIVGDKIMRWAPGEGVSVYRTPAGHPDGMTYDRQGRLIVAGWGARTVWRIEPDGRAVILASHYEGKKLNTPSRRHIRVFDVQPDGSLANGRVFYTDTGDEPGGPDGMKVDSAGNVYCTGSGGVHVLSPAGKLLGRIKLHP